MEQLINGRAQTQTKPEESLIDYRNRKARDYFKANAPRLRADFWARKAEA